LGRISLHGLMPPGKMPVKIILKLASHHWTKLKPYRKEK
jgi:hypothetical protein